MSARVPRPRSGSRTRLAGVAASLTALANGTLAATLADLGQDRPAAFLLYGGAVGLAGLVVVLTRGAAWRRATHWLLFAWGLALAIFYAVALQVTGSWVWLVGPIAWTVFAGYAAWTEPLES